MRIKKLSVLSLLCSVGIVLGLFESIIPFFNVIPGGKIGLANCVTLVVFSLFLPSETLLFGLLRSFVSSLLFSGIQSFLYSAVGCVFSVIAMTVTKTLLKEKVSFVGISILGALFFNIGQVAVCSLVIQNIQVLRYLSVLGIISAISGTATGYISKLLISYLNSKNIGMER